MVLLLMVAAYLLGSVPFGYLICRAKGINLFETGSKSSGATNVWRTLGWKLGSVTFIFDCFIKGWLPAWVAVQFLHSYALALAVGVCAVVGHNCSVFLRFKGGGKGVATTLGVVIAVEPIQALIVFSIWALVVVAFRYISVGSICGAIGLLVTQFLWPVDPWVKAIMIVLSALIVLKHKPNLSRLITGNEPRLKLRREHRGK